ncbi:MAG: hypothetical protein ACRDAM_12560, partial [Casimicrobium sp.]
MKIVQPTTVDSLRNYVFETVTAYFGYSLEGGVWTGQYGTAEAEQFAIDMTHQINRWNRQYLEQIVAWLESGRSVGAIFHAVPETK